MYYVIVQYIFNLTFTIHTADKYSEHTETLCLKSVDLQNLTLTFS